MHVVAAMVDRDGSPLCSRMEAALDVDIAMNLPSCVDLHCVVQKTGFGTESLAHNSSAFWRVHSNNTHRDNQSQRGLL